MPKITSEHEAQLLGLLMLDNRSLLENLRFGLRLSESDFQGNGHAKLYQNIVDLYERGDPITPATLGTFGYDGLDEYVDRAFNIGNEEGRAYARAMVEQSDQQRLLHALNVASLAIRDDKANLAQIQERLAEAFVSRRGSVMQPASLASIGQRIDANLGTPNKTLITPTGIVWLDTLLRGGLRSKRFIAIGGAQKNRKTSLLRNMLLGAALDKHQNPNMNLSVCFATFENDQEITYYDMVAMIAYRNLRAADKHREVVSNNPIVLSSTHMDGEIIQTAYENGKLQETWPAYMRNAVLDAMQVVKLMPIWVYDSLPENGGLETLVSLKQTIEMHYQGNVKEGQHFVIAVDYAQLVKNIGKDYEDMRSLSRELLRMSNHYKATVIALSQLNEMTNYAKANAKKSLNFVGTKGGGDLEAAVQNYFVTSYNRERPDYLTVEQSRARRSPYAKKEFEVHAPSGLML